MTQPLADYIGQKLAENENPKSANETADADQVRVDTGPLFDRTDAGEAPEMSSAETLRKFIGRQRDEFGQPLDPNVEDD